VAVDGPDCLDGKPKNVKGQHFAGFDSNAYDPANGTISFFQTIDAGPLLDANGALKEPFNVRARFDISNANATGYLRLIGDTEVAGDANALTLLAETTIPFTTENGFISDPAYNAVIPKGTIWPTSNPAILTIEFRFFLATVPTLWGCSVDDVRTGPYIPPGCEGRTIWADNNLDGSVDMVDFAEIQACLTTGMAEPPAALPEACACLDRDFNGQIGEPDVVEFIKCVTGPATPWSREAVPTCVP
jgi:hypothetical protein